MNLIESVRSTCQFVASTSTSVTINQGALHTFVLASRNSQNGLVNNLQSALSKVEWDASGWHYSKDAATGGPLTAQYILVVDALNFCFWPSNGLEYEHLAVGLKKTLEANPSAFSPEALANMTEDKLVDYFKTKFSIPLLQERVVRLQEVGRALLSEFHGDFMNLVRKADHSAVKLVEIITSTFPGFRDTSIYEGRLIHFYKRAQILAADLWGAYGRPTDPAHPFYFSDIHELTMFADYRIPQILNHVGILRYSGPLNILIDAEQEIPVGSKFEVEIRACTVVAVEMFRDLLKIHDINLTAVEVDWLLWNWGEKVKDQIKPHHRTLTIYY